MKRSMYFLSALCIIAVASAANAEKKDIVETAVDAGSFSTLATALKATGLVETLQGKGPFTVFAPTDAAFEKLPEGTIETLLKPENKSQLAAILTYHVVPGDVRAKQVASLQGAESVNGQRIDITTDGGVKVDQANVVKTDIVCSNGVIHVIDEVILPASDSIVATADKAGSFKTLLAAAKAAGLVGTLANDGPFTVFAPTDEAFAKLPEGTLASLLKPENKNKLATILKYHVASGRVYSDDVVAAGEADTLQGGTLIVSVSGGTARINNAELVATDIDASNGVIHVIDQVLLPPEKSISAKEARQMIRQAVAKGVPLFNAGHAEACSKIYMSTMREMLEYGDQMPAEIVDRMEQVVSHAEHTSCAVKRSWALRHGLDHVYHRMAELD